VAWTINTNVAKQDRGGEAQVTEPKEQDKIALRNSFTQQGRWTEFSQGTPGQKRQRLAKEDIAVYRRSGGGKVN